MFFSLFVFRSQDHSVFPQERSLTPEGTYKLCRGFMRGMRKVLAYV